MFNGLEAKHCEIPYTPYRYFFISCSYLPEPLNDPAVSSFGKKCNEETWSYIWIYKRGEELTATEEKCKIPIQK